ncbi:MAG: hypothetical protein AAB631_01115 [Patescibacteria group bacterium]
MRTTGILQPDYWSYFVSIFATAGIFFAGLARFVFTIVFWHLVQTRIRFPVTGSRAHCKFARFLV